MLKKNLKIYCFLLLSFGLVYQVFSQNPADSVQEKISKNDSLSVIISKLDTLQREANESRADKEKLREKILEPPKIENIFSFNKIFWTIVFLLITFFVIRMIRKALEAWAERSALHRVTIKSTIPIVRLVSWIIFTIIIVEGIFQPPLATLIAFSASIGVAVGFASQDILKNIFGGVVILIDRPFLVGDKIEVGSYYGEVIGIGLRSTRIVTADDSIVSIPNGELMNQSLSNSNAGESNCQVVAELYLPITVDTEKVRSIATEAAKVSRFIFLDKPIAVLFFNEVKERRSYLKMRLKAYVMDIRYEFAFKSDMTEIVMRELISQGIIDPKEVN
ncbi:mechanosensitive ion channel family protein [Flexithrix dorotheae]|uniref:mechanosensitive ion channel family protein n=1 Tax=Flexithrix dorotheae TaxID=70993 RepID=UPI000361F82A|nr:mechanosensitive ion channel domain-containing protein [Flexithrix dorotheae]